MEHSDKSIAVPQKFVPKQEKKGKKRHEILPGSYRINIPSRATRRGKQIPWQLIFPSREDKLISIKKFSGGKK